MTLRIDSERLGHNSTTRTRSGSIGAELGPTAPDFAAPAFEYSSNCLLLQLLMFLGSSPSGPSFVNHCNLRDKDLKFCSKSAVFLQQYYKIISVEFWQITISLLSWPPELLREGRYQWFLFLCDPELVLRLLYLEQTEFL